VAVAANVGILYDLLPNKLALGVGYRSEAKMKVANGKIKGTEDITALNGIINNINQAAGSTEVPYVPVPALEKDAFTAELPLPANLNTGISFRPTEKLLLAFDWQMIFWGAYEDLTLAFKNLGTQVSQKNYHNTDAYRFGAQYTVIDQLDLRLGLYYDETPVDDNYLTPESPSTNKLGTTIGLSFRPIPNLSIDAAFLYSNGGGSLGRDATSGSNPDKAGDGLDGHYEVQAFVPSVGLNFNF
jgi:long-chain fatty acid transport protein